MSNQILLLSCLDCEFVNPLKDFQMFLVPVSNVAQHRKFFHFVHYYFLTNALIHCINSLKFESCGIALRRLSHWSNLAASGVKSGIISGMRPVGTKRLLALFKTNLKARLCTRLGVLNCIILRKCMSKCKIGLIFNVYGWDRWDIKRNPFSYI